MATLPVTTCESERSFSMLKLIKTPLRSTVGQERLNGLAILIIHRSESLDPMEVDKEYYLATTHTDFS